MCFAIIKMYSLSISWLLLRSSYSNNSLHDWKSLFESEDAIHKDTNIVQNETSQSTNCLTTKWNRNTSGFAISAHNRAPPRNPVPPWNNSTIGHQIIEYLKTPSSGGRFRFWLVDNLSIYNNDNHNNDNDDDCLRLA